MPLWHPPAPQTPISVPGASPNTGLSPGITYASPTVPFYSSGSVIPSNLVVSTLTAVSETVSGFINLDGNILTTASGVGAELLLNGIPIATTANISSIQAWAEFPAISTINANSNLLINVSSVVGIPGQPLPILASQVAFGGLGELTGISTINGAPPGSGNAANWATYPATQDVNMNSQNLNSANQVNLNTGGNVVMLTAGAGNNLLVNGTPVGGGGGTPSTIAGLNTFMTATGTSGTATSAISAGGGLGGFITATANPGAGGISGGNITLTANGGTTPAGVFGRVDIVANEGVANVAGTDITTGGYVNIVANSGGALANLTSRIDLNAGGINMYAGITTPITSLFGYGFINALTGLSLVAGTFSSAFQVPGTVYLYGLTGIVLGSDTYATNLYPYWNGLTAPPNLTLNGRTTISGVARVDINNANNISFDALGAGAISGVQTINGSPYVPGGGGGVASLNGLTGALTLTAGTNITLTPVGNDITINSTGGSYPPVASFSTITIGTGGDISFSDATGFLRTSAIYGRNFDDLTIDAATGATLAISGGAGAGVAQSLISLIPDGSVVINNDVGTIPLTDGAGLTISPEGQTLIFPKNPAGLVDVGAITGLSTINGVAYPPSGTSAFVDSFQIYVAPNGNNTTGTGSQQKPFLSIGQAIIFRATLSTSTEVSIILSSGTYTETFTLTRNTYLVGVQTGEARQPCNIVGNIVLNDTTGSLGLSGLEITGSVSTTGGGATYTVFGCNITNTATAVNATAGTVFITECRISTTAQSVIISFSTLTIRDCAISTSGTGSCLSLASITTVRQCVFTSSSASTSASALINYSNTNLITFVLEFCRLEYTSTATDVGGAKSCIRFNGSGAITASVSNSLLLCEGAITASGGQIQCIQDPGAGAVALAYGQLIAGATAHHIAPTITKTQYNSVP